MVRNMCKPRLRFRQEVDCFGKIFTSWFGISHRISIISNGSALADQKVFETFVQISQEQRQVQTRGRLFWKDLYKPVRNQSSDLDYLKRSGFYGQKKQIASHLPEGCELWPQVLASRRLQIRKKVLLLQSFSIL